MPNDQVPEYVRKNREAGLTDEGDMTLRKAATQKNKRLRAFLRMERKREMEKARKDRDPLLLEDISRALSGFKVGTTEENLPQSILTGWYDSERQRKANLKRHQGGPIKQSGSYDMLAGEMVWDQAAVAAFGKLLNQFAYEKVGIEAGGGGSSPTVITDASSPTNIVNNNTTVIPPNPSGPLLPGSGRDLAVSHFRHA